MNTINQKIETGLVRRNSFYTKVLIQWPWDYRQFPYELAQNVINQITKNYPDIYLIENFSPLKKQDTSLINIRGIKVSSNCEWDEFYRGPQTGGMLYYLGKVRVIIDYPAVMGSWTGNGYIVIFSDKDDIKKKSKRYVTQQA